MLRRRGSFALVAVLPLWVGCSSLTRPDGEVLGIERAEPAAMIAPSPTTAIPTLPTIEGNGAKDTNVAFAAQPPQPPANPPAPKQGG